MKSRGQLYFSLFLLAVAGFAIASAAAWSFKTGFFPLAVAIPLFLLILAHLVLDKFGAPELAKTPAVEANFSGDISPAVARRRAVMVFCWIAGFIVAVYLIGFPWTVPLFMLLYLKLQSRASWVQSVALTVITWVGFYLLFQRLVHIRFEDGAIQTWLGI
jgi:hypothetical protein